MPLYDKNRPYKSDFKMWGKSDKVKRGPQPLKNNPNSLITRIKYLFVDGSKLSAKQIEYIICEKYPKYKTREKFINSVSSILTKLVNYGFLTVSNIRTENNGNIYECNYPE